MHSDSEPKPASFEKAVTGVSFATQSLSCQIDWERELDNIFIENASRPSSTPPPVKPPYERLYRPNSSMGLPTQNLWIDLPKSPGNESFSHLLQYRGTSVPSPLNSCIPSPSPIFATTPVSNNSSTIPTNLSFTPSTHDSNIEKHSKKRLPNYEGLPVMPESAFLREFHEGSFRFKCAFPGCTSGLLI